MVHRCTTLHNNQLSVLLDDEAKDDTRHGRGAQVGGDGEEWLVGRCLLLLLAAAACDNVNGSCAEGCWHITTHHPYPV